MDDLNTGKTTAGNVILSTSHLTKRYGMKRAVDDVSMTVHEGDIYGFVGLNGAGKTTVIRLITGLIKKDGGGFELFGTPDTQPLGSHRRRISSMVETPALYLNMTGEENLRMQCAVMQEKTSCIPDLLKLVGLDAKNKQCAKNYSLGMRQRLGIAMALVGDPALMLLDEPTNGLDPEGIIEVRDLLKNLNREKGITVIVSSHILTELSKLANTYGFIHNGKLLREISATEIEKTCGHSTILTVDDPQAAAALLAPRYTVKQAENDKIELDGLHSPTELVHLLDTRKIRVSAMQTVSRDLESYFIELIGGHAQ